MANNDVLLRFDEVSFEHGHNKRLLDGASFSVRRGTKIALMGQNGAGKSTHAEPILKALGINTFVNADYIARGLSGFNTEAVNFEAGRIMLKRLHDLADEKADFAFESTLSSRTFAFFLQKLKAKGYCYYFLLYLK